MGISAEINMVTGIKNSIMSDSTFNHSSVEAANEKECPMVNAVMRMTSFFVCLGFTELSSTRRNARWSIAAISRM